MPLRPFLPFFMLLLLGPAHRSAAAEVRVAVAANFAPCLEELAPVFAEASGHRIQPIVGSTGRLVAQITAGAPFDVFLAADSRSCRRLVADGLADGDSRFTYALGSLVLWLATAPATEDRQLARLLNVPTVQRIALANPRLAPYGAAAVQALQRSGLDPELGGRAVLGSSVGQTWQFAASGHVQAAFLALSQVIGQDRGWHMVVPADLHEPIRQDAVLLKSARDEPAARAFLRFLRSEAAGKIMTKFGYRKGDGDP
jgi:molybdate transport system substrate-binding protein